MQRSSVCLSVCLSVSVRPIVRPPHASAAGLLLSGRQAGDIDRLLPGAQQQMRTMSRGKLNTDLFETNMPSL